MHHSNTLPVTLRVSHGSILGPLPFLVFINDIPTLVKTARLLLFADDINCVKSVNNLSHCSHLQGDLCSLYSWSSSNISFNQEKQSFSDFKLVPALFLLTTSWTTMKYFQSSAIVLLLLLYPMTFPGLPIITK